jgi:hypothetical protein
MQEKYGVFVVVRVVALGVQVGAASRAYSASALRFPGISIRMHVRKTTYQFHANSKNSQRATPTMCHCSLDIM